MTKPVNPRRLARAAKGPTSFSSHYVCVVPVALAPAINQVLERNGHGPNNLSIPLYSAGNQLTHYACSVSLTSDAYSMLRAMFPPEAEASKNETFDEMLTRKSLHKLDPEA